METSLGSGLANNTSCEMFDDIQYTVVSGVRALMGLVSFLSCFIVILYIVLFKKHQYVIHRLVLYTCIVVMLNSLAIIIQKVDYVVQNVATDRFCVFAGFFEQYTSLMELLALACISHSLSYTLKHDHNRILEFIYIAICIIIPLILSGPPFVKLTYGKTGPWCWIKDRDENCTQDFLGIGFQFGLWFLPLVIVSIAITVMYLWTFIKVQKRARANSTWHTTYNPENEVHKGQLSKTVKSMLAYMPIFYLIVNLFALPNYVHWAIADEPVLALWAIAGVLPPLRGALLVIPYLFRKEARKGLNRAQITAAIKDQKVVQPYPIKQCNFTDSNLFPNAGDSTLDRQRPYRNPSVSHVASPSPPPRTVSYGTTTSNGDRVDSNLSQIMERSRILTTD